MIVMFFDVVLFVSFKATDGLVVWFMHSVCVAFALP